MVKTLIALSLLSDPSFGFARSLFAQGEYFRSIGEYQKWLYFHGEQDQKRSAQANFFIGRAYQEGDRHGEAIPYLRKAEPLGSIAKLRLADSLLRLDSPEGERLLFELGEDPRAQLLLSKKNLNISERSPLLAGAFSALLPGAGQLYGGRPGDAAFSLLTISSLALGANGSYKSNPTLGLAFGGLAAWLYCGNIYGAVDAVRNGNQKAKETAEKAIELRFEALCPDPAP